MRSKRCAGQNQGITLINVFSKDPELFKVKSAVVLLGGRSSRLIKLPVKGQCNGHFDQRGGPFPHCAILVKAFFPYSS